MSLFDDIDRNQPSVDEHEATTPCTEHHEAVCRQAEAYKAKEALLALEVYWRLTDPDFEHKASALREYGRTLADQLLSGYVHPSEAVDLMQDRYNSLRYAFHSSADATHSSH